MKAHPFQVMCAGAAKKPLLNAACKEDPAKLGATFGAVNLDIWTLDEQTGRDMTSLPNFVQGDVLDMNMFEDGHFGMVILGEFIEHCVPAAATKAMRECHRVLSDNSEARMIITFPLDGRPANVQHGKHLLKIIVEGETGHDITVAHQTVWSDEMLDTLFSETGFTVMTKTELTYAFVKDRKPEGWGIVLKKA